MVPEESRSRRTNLFDLSPIIVDASAFGSYRHCQALFAGREAGLRFFISGTLHTVLYEQYDRAKVFDTLGRFTWRYPVILPPERLDLWPEPWSELRPYLEPYSFKREYVEDIWDYYEASRLPSEVKRIILDEYSFLKQQSAILLYTTRTARYLHRWGITLLDATNKVYDKKRSLFERIRGARWIIGTLLASAGTKQASGDPLLDTIAAIGGVVLVLWDP